MLATPSARGELPRRLEPAGHAQVGQDGPGLVHHQEDPVAVPGLDGALQPGRRAGHEHPQGGRVVDGGQVEHDERTVEAEAVGRGAVEHASQVAVDETAQLERHVPAVLDQCRSGWCAGRRRPVRPGRGGRRRPGAGSVTSPSAGRRPVRGCAEGGVDGRPLAGEEVTPEAGHGQRCAAARSVAPPARRERRRRPGCRRPPSAVSSGLSRTDPPAGARRRRRPRPRARGPYSPLGSITQALRPKTA